MAVTEAYRFCRTFPTCAGDYMITRRKDYVKRSPSKDAKKIYIICEGKSTEPNYFSFFRGLSSNLELIVIPPENGTDPLKLIELAKAKLIGERREHTLDYMMRDRVWFAIDTDSWEKEGKIRPLREFCDSQNTALSHGYDELRPYEAWRVAQSNPCFEVWLYYHHYSERPDTAETDKADSVKSYVDAKINGGFDYQRDPVRLENAIANSERNFRVADNGCPDEWSTEQHLLAKEILPFVKSELDKLRNKLG